VERELVQHDPRLASLPRVLALSKADLVDPDRAAAARAEWAQRLGPDIPVIVTSSAAQIGLRELGTELLRQVPMTAEPGSGLDANTSSGPVELAEHRVFRPAAGRNYRVQQLGDGSYTVTGEGIERLVARYDLENDEAMAHLERRLRGIGVIRALEAAGFEAGDDVQIAGVAFDLDPEV
jgi:GTP-binding protein